MGVCTTADRDLPCSRSIKRVLFRFSSAISSATDTCNLNADPVIMHIMLVFLTLSRISRIFVLQLEIIQHIISEMLQYSFILQLISTISHAGLE